MERRDLVLAAMSSAGGASLSPVQIQKLFFLLDMNIGELVGGPHFKFKPYHYGPFDRSVYRQIEELQAEGLAEILPGPDWRRYGLTPSGQAAGQSRLHELPSAAQAYIGSAIEFVSRLSFTDLVSAVYRAYPEMRANSVFQE